jgi:hypothetical protein
MVFGKISYTTPLVRDRRRRILGKEPGRAVLSEPSARLHIQVEDAFGCCS